MDIKALSEQISPYIIARRRFYHAHPELTFQESETCASIRRDLEEIGITDIREMSACHGLLATIHGGHPGKTVALRTDIDALPVQEETGLSFSSRNDGCMHACGHDCHIAILLGAAWLLQSVRNELHGDVRLIVQPAEEACQGADLMIAEGAMNGVDAIYGGHVWGSLPSGKVSIEPGPRMAYAGLFEIDIEGVSAHGSAPHLGADAITAAASVITNLQQYVSRMNDPLSPLVLTIGTIHGGSRFNVISNHVRMTGSVRAYSANGHRERLTSIVEKTAECLGCRGILTYHDTIGPVINCYEEITALAQNAAGKLYGEDVLCHQEKLLISEDFASYIASTPGVYVFLGSRDELHPYTNHHEKYDVDESILKRGAAIMTQFAVDFLNA